MSILPLRCHHCRRPATELNPIKPKALSHDAGIQKVAAAASGLADGNSPCRWYAGVQGFVRGSSADRVNELRLGGRLLTCENVRCARAGPSGRPFGHLFGRPSRRLLAAASTSEEVGPKKPKRGAKGSPSPGGNGPLPGGPMPPPAASRPADGHGPPGVESEEEAEQFLGPYMDAVVKIYCIHSEPNFSMPWQRKRQYNSFSSGFAVSDGAQRWLLTNAHSVSYHTQVRVKRRGDDRKFTARVLSIGVDCDIALLTVEDDEFWADVVPLEFGPLPRLQESVAVVGCVPWGQPASQPEEQEQAEGTP